MSRAAETLVSLHDARRPPGWDSGRRGPERRALDLIWTFLSEWQRGPIVLVCPDTPDPSEPILSQDDTCAPTAIVHPEDDHVVIVCRAPKMRWVSVIFGPAWNDARGKSQIALTHDPDLQALARSEPLCATKPLLGSAQRRILGAAAGLRQ